MTPAHDTDVPDDTPQRRQPTPSPAPIPLRRIARTARRRASRRTERDPRPARPSTVWPCANDDPREGTGVLASWLLTAVIKIVTTYTQPGHRVLLLDATPLLARPTTGPVDPVGNQSRHGPYAGLLEAAWTVVRLGRGIDTHTIPTRQHPPNTCPGGAWAESESGPGSRTVSPTVDHHTGSSPAPSPGPDPAATHHRPDQFEMIITAAEPDTVERLHLTDWAGLLTPTGTLTVITHSHHAGGRLTDPAAALVRVAHDAGLRYHDRIALLHVPVRDGALVPTDPATCDRSPSPPRSSSTPVRHTYVHKDLFVFSRQPARHHSAGTRGDLR
ncbi:hypothetical protein [Actinocrispum wychmicini]|uniref:Uncharacterized protein n=1 Tax=Actinocrispum wychmicini TaxID=1213861 RepID=A0A4R2IWQ5_9PSEU|nr:hypothetical protein [Actinocrispum wychmicini]TCO49687.1 hypothetical protein EV192_11453 [Actinocrispum wychmicini]